MNEQAGRVVAGHTLLRHIGCDGAGGFGLGYLWEARDPTGRLVALKMASPLSLPLVRVKERNQHPNLVQLYGYWVFDESQYGLAIATDLHTRTPIRRRLEECRAEGHLGIPQDELLARIDQRWQEAVRTALVSKVSILTGGPGTGKTVVLLKLLQKCLAAKIDATLKVSDEVGAYLSSVNGSAIPSYRPPKPAFDSVIRVATEAKQTSK